MSTENSSSTSTIKREPNIENERSEEEAADASESEHDSVNSEDDMLTNKQKAVQIVRNVVRKRHVFYVQQYTNQSHLKYIRQLLVERGWLEMSFIDSPAWGWSQAEQRDAFFKRQRKRLKDTGREISMDERCKKLLRHKRCNLLWTGSCQNISREQCVNMSRTIVNHFPCARYTSKCGLMELLDNHLRWVCDVHANSFFPRCYMLSKEDDRKEFLDDYRLTTAIYASSKFMLDKLRSLCSLARGVSLKHLYWNERFKLFDWRFWRLAGK